MTEAAIGLARLLVDNRAANVYIKYASTLGGRDKALRLAQYASRFVLHLLTQGSNTKTGRTLAVIKWTETLRTIQSASSTARKLMRAGKFVDFLSLLVHALSSRAEDEVVRTLSILHKLGMFVFMLMDSVGLLHTLRIVALRNPAGIGRTAQKGWMLAIASQLLSGIYQRYSLALRERDWERVRVHVEKSADLIGDRECAIEEAAVRRQRTAVNRMVLVNALDLLIPVKGLGLVDLNEGLVGLAGTVTSLLGVQDILAKVM